jgi:hypothetical protein
VHVQTRAYRFNPPQYTRNCVIARRSRVHLQKTCCNNLLHVFVLVPADCTWYLPNPKSEMEMFSSQLVTFCTEFFTNRVVIIDLNSHSLNHSTVVRDAWTNQKYVLDAPLSSPWCYCGPCTCVCLLGAHIHRLGDPRHSDLRDC